MDRVESTLQAGDDPAGDAGVQPESSLGGEGQEQVAGEGGRAELGGRAVDCHIVHATGCPAADQGGRRVDVREVMSFAPTARSGHEYSATGKDPVMMRPGRAGREGAWTPHTA